MSDADGEPVVRFGHDGWHGRLAREVTFDTIEALSRASGIVLTRDDPAPARIVVGYDRRFLAGEFARSIAAQLASIGIEPWLIPKPVPTPVLSFTVRSVSASGGIMVSAGNRAPSISGVKLRADDGGPLPRARLDEIEQRIHERIGARRLGPTASVVEIDPVDDYLDALSRQVPLKAIQQAGVTVAIDSMWGAASELLPRLTDGGGSRSVEIRTTHNPRFPDMCAPNPGEPNLDRLRRTVQSGNPAFGVAFSGDASTLGLIDGYGRYVPPERVFSILAYYLLAVKRVRGLIGRSIALPTEVDRMAAAFRAPVRVFGFGLTEIAERLRQDDFRLVGDQHGNAIVPRHLPDSDAILTAMLLTACVVETGESITELLSEIDELVGPRAFKRSELPLTKEQRELVSVRLGRMEWPPEVGGLAVSNVQRDHGVRLIFEDDTWLLLRPDQYDDRLAVIAEAPRQETVDTLIESGRKLMLL